MAGRRPKPTKLKLLHGNPGKRKVSKTEPQPELGIPKPPKWLQGESLDEWNRITPELENTGVMALIDESMLAMYCQMFGRWLIAEKANMPLPVAYAAQVRLAAASFGLEPSSRAKLGTKPKEKANPFKDFMDKNGTKS